MLRQTARIALMNCLLLLCTVAVQALPTRIYGTDQLSSNLITSVVQDHQGYLWIGTEYGLNKFDGVRFTHYYSSDVEQEQQFDDIVRHLLVDRDGRLWVVGNRGVHRYNRQTDHFETVRFGESVTANINDIIQAPDGSIWVLRVPDGLVRIDPDSMTATPIETINRQLDKSAVCDNMYMDKHGRLWVAYQETGLLAIDTNTGQSRYYEEQLMPDNRAVDIMEDARGRLLVLTYTGVFCLDEQTLELEPVVTFPRNAVHRLFQDRSGQLYIGTSGSGLWTLDIDHHSVETHDLMTDNPTDLSNERVHAFLEDRDGNRWLGLYRRGLMAVSTKDNPFHFLPLNRVEGNNGNVLRTVYADGPDHALICQESGGITSIDCEGHARAHYLDTKTVMSLYDDGQGTLWAGTYYSGLYCIDRQTEQAEQMPLTAGQRISSIAHDRQGNLYTAVFSDGLHSYTPNGTVERTLGGGHLQLANPYLNILFTDRDGIIWIGHYYGIDVYNPMTDRLVDVKVPESLRPAIVYTIVQSPTDGSIWVGTNKGLFCYNRQGSGNGRWTHFTTHEGLPNDNVSSLVATADGSLWISTFRGLARRGADGRFTSYYRGKGLEEWSYLRGVGTLSQGGRIIFGNQNGLTSFVPDNIEQQTFRSDIVLTGMRLGLEDVNATTLSGGHPVIDGPLDAAGDITLSYLDNTFTLQFSTMDYRDPQDIHYEYRFSDEPGSVWHQTATGISDITLTRMQPGTHHLEVRACADGIFSPVKTLTIHITPPWYRSWWAYVLYTLLLIALIVFAIRYYRHRQQAIANEEKIKFFVDISHELRSPLTLIKSPLNKLLSTSHDQQSTRALRNIERNTNRLLTLTSQILSIRKIEKGQMTLHYAETPLAAYVENICHDFEFQAEKRHITLNFSSTADDVKVWIDQNYFDKVVSNLIGNAVKYVSDDGHIDVVVSRTPDGTAQLLVRDDGPGIDEAQLKKVFDRFYQASARPASGQMSYGIGLNLAQKLAVLHGGRITAANRSDGHGAEFVVRLPLGNGHLPKHQLVDADYFADRQVADETSTMPVVDADKPRRVRRKTSYRVAVVDDDEEIRTFLETELGESYHVQVYPNGQKALEGIVDTVPDLVISDVVMPGMDGFELLKRLKGSTDTSHIPVILLTTKTEHQSRLEGLEQGADAYVDKPFNLEELEARIAGLIANRLRMKGKYSGIQEQEDTVRKVELKGNDATLMEKIMKAVNARLDDSDFNVEALAEEVGLSRVQLHRRMKEMTGITVGEFIRNLRLQQAAKLLQAGDTTISQVTYAVGFANPTHFASAFKKHFGVTPSVYLAKWQARQNENETNE